MESWVILSVFWLAAELPHVVYTQMTHWSDRSACCEAEDGECIGDVCVDTEAAHETVCIDLHCSQSTLINPLQCFDTVCGTSKLASPQISKIQF